MGSYRDNPPAVAAIEITSETESDQGWLYDAEILWAGAGVTNHAITLAWVDHDHLSGGRTPPAAVIDAILTVLAEHLGPDEIPPRFDAATARRLAPDLDNQVRQRL